MRSSLIYGVGAGILLVGSAHGMASEVTWQGGGSSPTTFNEGDNWIGNAAPADSYTSSGDVAVLPATVTANQPVVTASQGLTGMRFDGSGWTVGGSGQKLTILGSGQPGGGGIVTTNTSGTNTINTNVSIATKDSPATGFSIAAGGTLAVFGDVSRTAISGGGAIVKSGNGVLELNGGGGFNLNVDAGIVRAIAGSGGLGNDQNLMVNTGGTYDLYGTNVSVKNLNLSGGATLTGSSSTIRTMSTHPYNIQTISGLIDGNLAMSYGNSTNIASGSSYTYAGGTTIRAGTLSVDLLSNGGQASAIGQSSSDAANLKLGGTLKYTGAAVTIDRGYTVTNTSAAFDSSGTGALVITGPMVAGQAVWNAGKLTLKGTNTDANTLTSIIADGSNRVISVAKSNAGTWILSGDNAYTGGTTITSGTLLVNNATGSGTGSGAVTMSAGVFGGTGSITSAVTIGDGGGTDDSTLSPGSLTTPISGFTVGALTFNSDGSLAVQLDTNLLIRDHVNAGGPITLGDGLALLQLSDMGNAVVAPNTVFTLLQSWGNISGYFRDLAPVNGIGPDVTVGSNTYRLDYNAHTVTLTAVPEPSMLGLFGVAGMGMIRRRRRKC